jgi:hypothetical protein
MQKSHRGEAGPLPPVGPAGESGAAEPATAVAPSLRSVEVVPPGTTAETANVLRLAALIVLATWIYIAGTGTDIGTGGDGGGSVAPDLAPVGGQTANAGAARDLMPYQKLFITLGSDEQRMFRELQEGLLEAENVRGSVRGGGQWPAPAALAALGVPPFADAAAPRRHRYRWEMRHDGLFVGYLGAAEAGAPAFLLLVQEPDPRAPPDPAAPPAGAPNAPNPPNPPNDEVHHRLADGTVLHVGIWMHAAGQSGAAAAGYDGDALLAAPYARGWTQVLVGAPGR